MNKVPSEGDEIKLDVATDSVAIKVTFPSEYVATKPLCPNGCAVKQDPRQFKMLPDDGWGRSFICSRCGDEYTHRFEGAKSFLITETVN